MSEVEGLGERGRPLVKWENTVDVYMREFVVGGTGGPFAMATPLGEVFRGNEVSEL